VTDAACLPFRAGSWGYLDADGKVCQALPLPEGNYSLATAATAGTVLVLGGYENTLYRFVDDGSLDVLLESDEPLVAATAAGTHVYAATQNTIMEVKYKTPEVLFVNPEHHEPIISIAASTTTGLLFFSTPHQVYMVKDGIAESIIYNSGGQLRIHDDQLLVLDTERGLLYRVTQPLNKSTHHDYKTKPSLSQASLLR